MSIFRNFLWKLVTLDAGAPWALFSIESDRTETKNVADQHPEVVEELDSLWHHWAEKNNVIPKP
ncbi:arylsulfatase [Algoriphagus sp. 4150]|uniref:hypothetical protein n=1 Tax=Algoriphagus sp. 4150 TaxID=2817756 RepID=UPI002865148A|nr:hypothetical protein [Algoriphagus sp. 4150]MDR7132184.1 arylsulfatase [Algoriphagus sp. 4150]